MSHQDEQDLTPINSAEEIPAFDSEQEAAEFWNTHSLGPGLLAQMQPMRDAAPTTYERVTYKPEGAARARSIILRDPASTGMLLTGIEVNREGDEVAPRGVDERRHVIDLSLVTRRRRMAFDNHYGYLVPAEDAGRRS